MMKCDGKDRVSRVAWARWVRSHLLRLNACSPSASCRPRVEEVRPEKAENLPHSISAYLSLLQWTASQEINRGYFVQAIRDLIQLTSLLS